jgi:hypothetical protein
MLARQGRGQGQGRGSIAGARRACRPLASLDSRGEGRPTYLKGLERSTTGLSVSPTTGVSQRIGVATKPDPAAAVAPGPWLDSDGLPPRRDLEQGGPGGPGGGGGGGGGGGAGGGGGPSHEQLYQVGERRRAQQTILARRRLEQLELQQREECTFAPRTNVGPLAPTLTLTLTLALTLTLPPTLTLALTLSLALTPAPALTLTLSLTLTRWVLTRATVTPRRASTTKESRTIASTAIAGGSRARTNRPSRAGVPRRR